MATELTVPDDLMNIKNFPKYEYTFKIIKLLYESGTIEVEYTPKDTRLTKIVYALPVKPTFNKDDIGSFVELFAPHDRWFAQEQMLSLNI